MGFVGCWVSGQSVVANPAPEVSASVTSGLTVKFIDAVTEVNTVRNDRPILSILTVLSSTNNATNVVASVYQHTRRDEAFINRYAPV